MQAASAIGVAGLIPGVSLAQAMSEVSASSMPEPSSVRETLSLDKGWRFHEGDIEIPWPSSNTNTYDWTKTGAAGGAAAIAYDDSQWPVVTVPHDFVSFQPAGEHDNGAQGFRPRGYAWYRNTLRFEESDRGKHIELQLDGIATLATIWFNGVVVCHSTSGYVSNYIDLTPYVVYGDVNTLAIRVDAHMLEGWWYEGGGIYRHAWVVKRNPVHITTDGVYAFPVKSGETWTIPVEVTLYNMNGGAAEVQVIAELKDASGAVVKTAKASASVPSLDQAVAKMTIGYDTPKLWSTETPNLYTVHTRVLQNGKLVDESTVETGFRTLHFDAQKGLFLNGQHIKVQGVCNHHDHAGVGTAISDSLWAFRLKKLKELGVNAMRCSHNAPSNVFLKLADRLGFLVMDENRMFNPSPEYLDQLKWMVRRDRNHPSVYLWSVFNEEPMQGSEQGAEMVRRMSAAVKQLDNNRPVTAAMSGGMFEPHNVSQVVDVVGFNYQQDKYDAFHAANPDKPMMSSEDTSAFMTRGEYISDREGRHVIASYDDEAAPWGETHLAAWKAIAQRDFIAGGFVWTGFDYHGEPTPLTWPANSSVFGIMDLCGFEKAAFYMHQAQWVKDRPVLWLIPHWNWKAGDTVRVMAMTNLDEVELSLNGKVIGRQKADPWAMNTWHVPFAPGRLQVVGFKAGQPVAKTFVETTGEAAALKVTPERPTAAGDGIDTLTVRVEAVDAQGRTVPLAQNACTFEVTGGDIIGVGNGDQDSLEPEKGNKRKLFNGLAQVIVQTREGGTGTLTVTARADGLKAGTGSVKLIPTPAWPRQVVTGPMQPLPQLRLSPVSAVAPQAVAAPDDKAMEKWERLRAGSTPEAAKSDGYVMAVTRVTPYAGFGSGAKLVFNRVKGPMSVYVDGKVVAQKSDAGEGMVTAPLPGQGTRSVVLLFHTKAGEAYGLPGRAYVMA
jgi:beta-galactosidase